MSSYFFTTQDMRVHTCGRRRRRHRRVPGGAAGPRVTAAHRQTRIGAPGAASGRWTTLKMSISHAARSPGEGALTNEREAASRRPRRPPRAPRTRNTRQPSCHSRRGPHRPPSRACSGRCGPLGPVRGLPGWPAAASSTHCRGGVYDASACIRAANGAG